MKQRLIEELERSQRRMETMRQHYEEKLMQLSDRIRATEQERDKVLANISEWWGTAETLGRERATEQERDKVLANISGWEPGG